MSDTRPVFTPPEPAPRHDPAPPLPSQTFPPPMPSDPSPAGAQLPALAIVGIIAGSVLLFGALGVGAVVTIVTAQTIVQSPFNVEIALDPVIVGVPGPTTAVEPLDCSDSCFGDEAFAELVVADGDLQRLGLTVSNYGYGDYISSDTSVEYTDVLRFWNEERVSPEACFFSYFSTPISTPLAPRIDSNKDQVEYIQGLLSSDEYSALNISARTFASTAAASEHMASLDAQVKSCDKYKLPETRDTYATETLVSPAAGLHLPASVAAVGWVESSDFGRYYAFDLQRGNIVVRHTVNTDGVISERDFRSFVEAYALQLSTLPLTDSSAKVE